LTPPLQRTLCRFAFCDGSQPRILCPPLCAQASVRFRLPFSNWLKTLRVSCFFPFLGYAVFSQLWFLSFFYTPLRRGFSFLSELSSICIPPPDSIARYLILPAVVNYVPSPINNRGRPLVPWPICPPYLRTVPPPSLPRSNPVSAGTDHTPTR